MDKYLFKLIFNDRNMKRYLLFGVIVLVFSKLFMDVVSPDNIFEYWNSTASENIVSAIGASLGYITCLMVLVYLAIKITWKIIP